MGRKQPSQRQWTVHLTPIYRRDRDERIARAYELALPVVVSRPPQKTREEETENEVAPAYRHLRARL
jgi:hypothetical protein